MAKSISIQALHRLPLYLQYLKTLPLDTEPKVSAKSLGTALGFGEVLVRKDLAAISDGGKPKVGYCALGLIEDITHFLGYDNTNDAVLVGAGRLGRAILSYDGFQTNGLDILAAFDVNSALWGKEICGKTILPLDKLGSLCNRMKIEIGIITVPASVAQEACDLLVESGIRAIWNFAPTHLVVPEGVILKSENLAASLAVLSKSLAEQESQSKHHDPGISLHQERGETK